MRGLFRAGLLGLLAAVCVACLGAAAFAQSGDEVAQEFLGEFTFIGDGVIEFTIDGDRIIGLIATAPESTGIQLVGGVRPCGGFAGDVVFDLDRTGTGQWFWYSNSPCERLGGAPVTVAFTVIGATATGERPASHPRFDGNPVSHAMIRTVPLLPTTTTAAPATTATSAPVTTEGNITTTTELIVIGVNDSEPEGSPFLPYVLTGLVLGIGLVGWALRRRKRPPPIERPPERSWCHCSGHIEIEGPTEFALCCDKPTLTLRGCEGVGSVEQDELRVHLDFDVDGRYRWNAFDAILTATIIPNCRGGGELLIDQATAKWTVDSHSEDGVVLVVTATVPVRCEDGSEHPPLTLKGVHKIFYTKGKCRVGVMVKRNAINRISHVDMHIICGDYSEIFGYFPAGNRTFSNTIDSCPGAVIRVRETAPTIGGESGLAAEIPISIGVDYNNSSAHSSHDWDVYWFEMDDCKMCHAVRNEWENLYGLPGTYWLTSNNCATQAGQILEAAGVLPEGLLGPVPTPAYLGLQLDGLLQMGQPPEAPARLETRQEVRR